MGGGGGGACLPLVDDWRDPGQHFKDELLIRVCCKGERNAWTGSVVCDPCACC